MLGMRFPNCVSDKPYLWRSVKSGLEWKHTVRESLDYLRRNNIIEEFNKRWFTRDLSFVQSELKETERLIEERNSKLSRQAIADYLRKITPRSSRYIVFHGRRISRDIDTIAKLKVLREYRCQICGVSIKKKNGGLYIEGAHITPKKWAGPEVPENILILCPNHHKEFDFGDTVILEQTKDFIKFKMNQMIYSLTLSF